MRFASREVVAVFGGLALSLLTACGTDGGMSVSESSLSSAEEARASFFYLRCNATSWEVNGGNRLVADADANLLTLAFEVKESWLVTSNDECSLTETFVLNQWGHSQNYYTTDAKDIQTGAAYHFSMGPGSGDGSYFRVQYPKLGKYLATVNRSAQTLTISPADVPPPVDPTCYQLAWSKSGEGQGKGQFLGPMDVAANNNGVSFVVDQFNKRVQKFDWTGKFVSSFGTAPVFPSAIALGDNSLYLTVTGEKEALRQVSLDGKVLKEWPIQGMGSAIARDGQGNLYVARIVAGFPYKYFVSKYSKDGALRKEWGGERGSAKGKFDMLWGLTVAKGKVYATDMTRVQVFDLQGRFLRQFALPGGAINGPHGLAVDANGLLYLADHERAGFWKLKPNGEVVTFVGLAGKDGIGYEHPVGISVNDNGRVWVSGFQYLLRFVPCAE